MTNKTSGPREFWVCYNRREKQFVEVPAVMTDRVNKELYETPFPVIEKSAYDAALARMKEAEELLRNIQRPSEQVQKFLSSKQDGEFDQLKQAKKLLRDVIAYSDFEGRPIYSVIKAFLRDGVE